MTRRGRGATQSLLTYVAPLYFTYPSLGLHNHRHSFLLLFGQRRFVRGPDALDNCCQVDQAGQRDRTEVHPLPINDVRQSETQPHGGSTTTPHRNADVEVPVQNATGRSVVAGGLPRLALAHDEVKQGERVRPAVDHLDGERRQAELVPVPDREHHQGVDQAGNDQQVVLQSDQVREERHQAERNQRRDEGHGRRVDVVAEPRQIPRAAAQRHLGLPELPREKQAHRAHAPAVLLRQERRSDRRAHTGRQGDGDVLQVPALASQVETRVNVLGMADLGGATVIVQRRPSVKGVRTDTDRSVTLLT